MVHIFLSKRHFRWINLKKQNKLDGSGMLEQRRSRCVDVPVYAEKDVREG